MYSTFIYKSLIYELCEICPKSYEVYIYKIKNLLLYGQESELKKVIYQVR